MKLRREVEPPRERHGSYIKASIGFICLLLMWGTPVGATAWVATHMALQSDSPWMYSLPIFLFWGVYAAGLYACWVLARDSFRAFEAERKFHKR